MYGTFAKNRANSWCWAADQSAASWRRHLRVLGAGVTQMEMAPRILLREDPDASDLVTERFRREGIDVRVGHKAKRFEVIE